MIRVPALPLTLLLALWLVALLPASGTAQPVGTLEISPRGGPAGSEVELIGEDLPEDAELVLAFGTFAEYRWIGRMESDGEGRVSGAVTIPDNAGLNQAHYLFLKFPGQPPMAISEAFHVTRRDGGLSALGELEEGEEGPLLRGSFNEVYCLLGTDRPEIPIGALIRVDGTLGAPGACPRGIPVEVSSMELRRSPGSGG